LDFFPSDFILFKFREKQKSFFSLNYKHRNRKIPFRMIRNKILANKQEKKLKEFVSEYYSQLMIDKFIPIL
jgi:hypothetical protein